MSGNNEPCHYIGSIKCIGSYLYEAIHRFQSHPELAYSSLQGKVNDDDDIRLHDNNSVSSDVEEDKIITEKCEFERNFILKHRSLFGEKLVLQDI